MSEPLPTSGPLGRRVDYEVTNKELLDNTYKQNRVLNTVQETVKALGGNLQTLATTVESHAKVIELLLQIKSIAIWALMFLGAGGIFSLLNWIKLWLQH